MTTYSALYKFIMFKKKEDWNDELVIEEKGTSLTQSTTENHFHAAGALHGSVFFKMLDDAAFFAAQAKETTYFINTVSFDVKFFRKHTVGLLTAVGKLEAATRQHFVASAQITNEKGKLIASGSGVFLKTQVKLEEVEAYTMHR